MMFFVLGSEWCFLYLLSLFVMDSHFVLIHLAPGAQLQCGGSFDCQSFPPKNVSEIPAYHILS